MLCVAHFLIPNRSIYLLKYNYSTVIFSEQKSNIKTEVLDHNSEIVNNTKTIIKDELEVKNLPNENADGVADNVSIFFIKI